MSNQNRVRENLFEAKLNLPQEYIDKVKTQARESYGAGPTRQDFMRMGQLLNEIFSIQHGHEEELTELGKKVIDKFYGPIIDNVKLDIKIVDPNDEEKLEMAQQMLQQSKQEKPKQEQPKSPEEELKMPEREFKGIEHDIDKRKIINNIMQGEAQNVHDMMYDMKDEVEEITGSNRLLDLYMEFLSLNKKFDWDNNVNLEQMMSLAPQMANAMQTSWGNNNDEGGGEQEGGDENLSQEPSNPKIKARVLDLPMLIHETVKGIYELIAAGAIDPDRERAQKIMAATDTLENEQEDIRFGPYIAKDLRNYINVVADTIPGAYDIPNMREFIFGQMVIMPSQEFVRLITAILLNEDWPKKIIADFINKTLEEFNAYNKSELNIDAPEDEEGNDELADEESNELIDFMKTSLPSEAPEPSLDKPKKKWVEMGQAELNYQLNKAIDSEDWDTAKEIQQYLKTNESDQQLLNDMFDLID